MKTYANKANASDVWAVVVKALLLVCGVVGQIATYGGRGFMSSKMLMYYTNQSNWVIMAVTAIFLVYAVLKLVRGERAPVPPNGLQIVRYAATTAITLTFLVFSVLLTPQMLRGGNGAYLTSLSNLCVHNLVPLLAILDWCLFGFAIEPRRWTFLWCAAMPLYYVGYALLMSTTGPDAFGEGLRVPYFFFDYEQNGWLTVSGGRLGFVWWFLILCAAVLAMGYGLMAVARAVKNRHAATAASAA